ncbi:retrovirus-related pol polyprotein from transposon TNT 1-94 [Tanacetum coccineum]
MAKASPTQAWLWYQRLSHLNFDYINLLSKKDVVIGLPKLKYVASINGKKYILNGIVERQNCTLIEAASMMLSASKLPLDGENLDKRTRLIFESIHLSFDEIKAVTKMSVADTTAPSKQELDLLFGPLYDEFFNTGTSSVNKSSSPTDNSKQQDTPPTTNNTCTTEPTTTTSVNVEENNENQAADTQFQQDEFINPFCTSVREVAASSSRNIDNFNMNTFNKPQDSKYQWTKDHPLSQVHGNPSKPMQTR